MKSIFGGFARKKKLFNGSVPYFQFIRAANFWNKIEANLEKHQTIVAYSSSKLLPIPCEHSTFHWSSAFVLVRRKMKPIPQVNYRSHACLGSDQSANEWVVIIAGQWVLKESSANCSAQIVLHFIFASYLETKSKSSLNLAEKSVHGQSE